jgi:hypothetical protein
VRLDEPDQETGNTPDLADDSLSAEEQILKRERLAAIRSKVNALPERQRVAVIMHKYQQMDYREIAGVLKLSESATKSLLFRAYETLARTVERVRFGEVEESSMNCNQIRELLPELAAGMDAATPEVEKHIASCAACAAHLRDLQKTMALLDEWQAPEPSPYFDTRLQARLREEMARPAAGWLGWLRRPAWAMSLAAWYLRERWRWHWQQVLFLRDRSHRPILHRSVCRCSREPPSAICRRWRGTTSCTPISMCSTNCRCRTT